MLDAYDGTHKRIESMVSSTTIAERMNDEAIDVISLSSSSDTETQSSHKTSSETINPTNTQKHRIFQYTNMEIPEPTGSQLSEVEMDDPNKLLFHSDTQISPKKKKLTKSPKKQSKINNEKANTRTLLDEASSVVYKNKSNEPAIENEMEKTTKFIYNFSKLILLIDTAETIG